MITSSEESLLEVEILRSAQNDNLNMTNGIKIIHPDERSTATAQTSGMKREAAISPELTGSQTIWVGLVTTPAGMNGG